MANADSMDPRAAGFHSAQNLRGIFHDLDNCPMCGKTVRSGGLGARGVKRGFRLLHDACASKYDERMNARESALQGTSWGNVTVLPDCRNTEGYFNWTQRRSTIGATDEAGSLIGRNGYARGARM